MSIRNKRLSPKSQVLGIRRGMLTDRIEAIRVAKSKEIGLELTTPQILTMLVAMYENQKR
jgi:hypothetical protein